MTYQIRVTDSGLFQVYSTQTGIDQRDIGPPRRTPRGAAALCDSLAATGTARDGADEPGVDGDGGSRSDAAVGGRPAAV